MKIKPLPNHEPQSQELSDFYAEPLRRRKQLIEERGCAPMFKELTAEELQSIKSHSRERGVYERELNSWLETDSPGGQVDLTEGTFDSKNANTVMQGFRNAIKKLNLSDQVSVVLNEDNVYLIRRNG